MTWMEVITKNIELLDLKERIVTNKNIKKKDSCIETKYKLSLFLDSWLGQPWPNNF